MRHKANANGGVTPTPESVAVEARVFAKLQEQYDISLPPPPQEEDDNMEMSDEDRAPEQPQSFASTARGGEPSRAATNDDSGLPVDSRLELASTSLAARSALLKSKRKAALKAKHLALTKNLLESKQRATPPPPPEETLQEEAMDETDCPTDMLKSIRATQAEEGELIEAHRRHHQEVRTCCRRKPPAVPRVYIPQDISSRATSHGVDQVSQAKQRTTFVTEKSSGEEERVPAEQDRTESLDFATNVMPCRDAAVPEPQRKDHLLRQIAEAQERLQILRKSQRTMTNESPGAISEAALESESIANQELTLGAHLADLQLEEAYLLQVGGDASSVAVGPSRDVTCEALINDWQRQELLRRKKAAEQKKQLSHYKHLLSKQGILLDRQKAETEATSAKIDKLNEQRREGFTQLQKLPDKVSELYARQRILEGMLARSNEELKPYGKNTS